MLFLAVLIAIGIIIFKQLSFFIGAFLGAIAIYVVVRKFFFRIIDKYRWKPWVAALVIVLGIAVILSGAGYLVFEVTATQIPDVDTPGIVAKFNVLADNVNDAIGFEIVSQNMLGSSYSSVLAKILSSIFNTTYSFAANVFMMLVILYFMLIKARKMEKKILLYQPFQGRSLQMIEKEMHNMIFSNVIVIPIVLFGQGLVASLIYWLLGIENFVFWAFLTALCGLIPMIGTAIVSFPLGIFLISAGQLWQGIVLIVCGLFVIANVDNLIRIIFMNKYNNTPPLVVIFGVILGIPLFGFWGIIFGPLLISGFLLLIKIYYHEYDLLEACDPSNPEPCDPDQEKY